MNDDIIKKSIFIFNLKRIIETNGLFIRDLINHIIVLILKTIIKNKIKSYQNTLALINSERMGDLFLSVDLINSLIKSNKYKKIYLIIQSQLVDIMNELKLDCIVIPYKKNKYRYNIVYRYNILSIINNLQCNTILNISPERGSLNDELSIVSQSYYKISLKPS